VETETTKVYIGLGSNLGDRAGNLLLATRGLMEAGLHVCRLSAIYETEPVGVEDHHPYLNAVAEIDVANVTPSQILARTLRIEYLLGRRHKFLKAPRTADLDLLFYGDTHIDKQYLQIPHKNAHLRRFVLVPMAELAPHFIHPVEKKTIQELLETVQDFTVVKRWNAIKDVQDKDIHQTQTFSKSSTS
jgi:2-amino-4-hydroxy-6-hydroxymethyldihydropteridine diphosphokinase